MLHNVLCVHPASIPQVARAAVHHAWPVSSKMSKGRVHVMIAQKVLMLLDKH